MAELGGRPLIGFAGAPFTLASYLVEGGPSKTHERTRALMYGNPRLWNTLMGRLADITMAFLRIQVDAGAAAVQLFDSWVGVIGPDDYRRAILPHVQKIFDSLAATGVPRIHFGVGTGELLGLMGEAGADVVGVDWRVPLDQAARRVEPGKALQGNLDPAVLLAPWEVIEAKAKDALDRGRAAEGHVFNLGHGVLPDTDPGVLARLTDYVHDPVGPPQRRHLTFPRKRPPWPGNCRPRRLTSNTCSINWPRRPLALTPPPTRLRPRPAGRWSNWNRRSARWPGTWPRPAAGSWPCWPSSTPAKAGRRGTCRPARPGCRGSASCRLAPRASTSAWPGR